MAASQDPSDNPVAINVVPLVDIIFCLCVFFMCSFKFKQMEGKFDSWLPRNQGPPDAKDVFDPALIHEVRVAITFDPQSAKITRRLGRREYPDDVELAGAIAEQHAAWVSRGMPDAPVTIDADVRVPWSEIVRVIDLVRGRDAGRIEFAMGARPERRR